MKDINLDLSLFEQVVLDEDGRAHGVGWAGESGGKEARQCASRKYLWPGNIRAPVKADPVVVFLRH